MFRLLEKSVFDLAYVIKTIPEVRKLLYYTTPDALSKEDVSVEDINPYIFVSPVLEIYNTEPFNKSNFISIGLVRAEPDEDGFIESSFRIDILCQNEIWEINDNKIRPLTIVNEISNKIENMKLSPSHKLFIFSVERLILNTNICGYSIVCAVNEGGGLEDEF